MSVRSRQGDRERAYSIILATLLSLMAILSLGACSSGLVSVGPTDLGLATEPLAIGAPSSRAYIAASSLERGTIESEVVTIREGDVLEFVPFVRESSTEAVETYAVTEGRQELLSSALPVSLEEDVTDPGSMLSRARVQVDLGPYRGRDVRLKWVLSGSDPAAEGFLGDVRLRNANQSPNKRRPDILLICSDTHRYDHFAGEKGKALMPFIHSLSAEEGAVVYQQAFSTGSWTLPAVASVLTGLFPRYHRVGQRGDAIEDVRSENIPPGQFPFGNRLFSLYSSDTTSLPERLSHDGYHTALVASNPLYFLSGLGLDGNNLAIDAGAVPGDKLNEHAFQVIRSSDPLQPLYLLVHYIDVHQWEPWYFLKDQAASRSPASGSRQEAIRRSYSQAVRESDRYLESLVDAWRSARNWENTLFVFFSDHGESLLDPDDGAEQDEVRLGHGNSMSDDLLRIPLLVKYPRSFGIDSTEAPERNVSLVDLAPTILDAAEIDYDEQLFSGVSMARASDDDTRDIYADFQLYGPRLSSVRRGHFKAVIRLDDNKLVLQNWVTGVRLGVSPLDANSLGDELSESFESYRRDGAPALAGNSSVPQPVNESERQVEQLKSLGYIQ